MADREQQYRLCRWMIPARREQRKMLKAGYRYHETDWEIVRGPSQGDVIVDAKVSYCGLGVWTKIGPREGAE